MSQSTDFAMQNRIKTHMTADHAASLSLYLQHYARIPASHLPDSPTGKLALDDITLEHMVISYPEGRNFIPFDPPLTSYAQTRERVVAMHKDCLTALDLSDTKVHSFVWPNKLWEWLIHAVVFWCWVSFGFSRDQITNDRTLVGQTWSLGGLSPGLARFTALVARPVVLGMVAIHAAEATYFAMGRARRHGLKRWSSLWWSWFIAVFNGGIATFTRFDDYVRELEQKAKSKGQH